MSWGLVGGAAISLVGGAMGSNASDKAAKQQQAGVQAGIDSEERMFDKSLELQQPYRELGYSGIEGMASMSDPTQRAAMKQGYYDSDEYAQESKQVEQQQLRNAAATGGVRGGANQLAMAEIAPALGNQYLANQENRYINQANIGQGAVAQGSNQASDMGGAVSSLQQQSAQAGAANSLAQGNIWGNVVNDVSALGLDYLNKGK